MSLTEYVDFSFNKNNSKLSFSSSEFLNEGEAAEKIAFDEKEFLKENIIPQYAKAEMFNTSSTSQADSWSARSHLSLSSNLGNLSLMSPNTRRVSIGAYFASRSEPLGELNEINIENRPNFGLESALQNNIEEPFLDYLDYSQSLIDIDKTLKKFDESDTNLKNRILEESDEYAFENEYLQENFADKYAYRRHLNTIVEVSQEIDTSMSHRDSNGSKKLLKYCESNEGKKVYNNKISLPNQQNQLKHLNVATHKSVFSEANPSIQPIISNNTHELQDYGINISNPNKFSFLDNSINQISSLNFALQNLNVDNHIISSFLAQNKHTIDKINESKQLNTNSDKPIFKDSGISTPVSDTNFIVPKNKEMNTQFNISNTYNTNINSLKDKFNMENKLQWDSITNPNIVTKTENIKSTNVQDKILTNEQANYSQNIANKLENFSNNCSNNDNLNSNEQNFKILNKESKLSLASNGSNESFSDLSEFLKSSSTPIKLRLSQNSVIDTKTRLKDKLDITQFRDDKMSYLDDLSLDRDELALVKKYLMNKIMIKDSTLECNDMLDKYLDSCAYNTLISSFQMLPDHLQQNNNFKDDPFFSNQMQEFQHNINNDGKKLLTIAANANFDEVCCVGLSITTHISIVNTSSRMVKLLFKIINNEKHHTSFHVVKQALLEKYVTEKIKIVFTPQQEGKHEAQLLIYQSIIGKDKTHSLNIIDSYMVKIFAKAENPSIKILCDGIAVENEVDFGELPLSSSDSKMFTIFNNGKSSIPLVLCIHPDCSNNTCFEFASALTSSKYSSFVINKCKSIMNVFLLGRSDCLQPLDNFQFLLNFRTPQTNQGFAYKINGHIDIFLNQNAPRHSNLATINLTALVGLAKISVKSRNLSLLFDDSKISKSVMLQNTGQINLSIDAKTLSDLFKVEPDQMVLLKNEQKSIEIFFCKNKMPVETKNKIESQLLLSTQCNGPRYEIKLNFINKEFQNKNLKDETSNIDKKFLKCCDGFVSIHPSIVIFPATKLKNVNTYKVEIRNKTSKTIDLEVKLPNPPFIIQHENFSALSNRYIRMPIKFSPQHLGTFTSEVIIKITNSQHKNHNQNCHSNYCDYFTISIIGESID